MAVQGHPRSLISVPIESAYATSYWSSIVTLVVTLALFQRYCRFSNEKSDPIPIPPEILGCSPWTRLPMLWLRRAKTYKLIRPIHVISFELTQHTRPRYINVTERQTDRQTDGQLSVAIPRDVHRAVNTGYFKMCRPRLTEI